jgi:hypothetical protein
MKKLILLTAAAIVPGLLTIAADKKPDLSKLPAPAAKTGLTFEKDIKPILEKSCVKCHGAEKPKGKFQLDTLEHLLKGGESGKAVIAGKSADSPAVHFVADLVADMEMPPKDKRDRFPALTKDQIALLRAWIDQGAK